MALKVGMTVQGLPGKEFGSHWGKIDETWIIDGVEYRRIKFIPGCRYLHHTVTDKVFFKYFEIISEDEFSTAEVIEA